MPYWIISTEISGRNTAMYRETNFIFPYGSIIVNIKLDEENPQYHRLLCRSS